MRHDVPVKLEDNNGMWSRVYGDTNERREHITFSGNEDTTMDNLRGKSRRKKKSGIRLYNYTSGCQNISSGNITRTEQTKLTCSHQEKGRTDRGPNLTKEVM